MSSSTSNSKNEFKVCLAVLVLLVLLECLVRVSQNRLSLDLVHLSTMQAVAQSFRASTAGKVLFLGNSLTREGVSLEIIKKSFSVGSLNSVNWQKVYPDDTRIGDWYYLYQNLFYRTGDTPDVLVVSFIRNQVADEAVIQPRCNCCKFRWSEECPRDF